MWSLTSRSGIAYDQTLVVGLTELENSDIILDAGILAASLAGNEEATGGQ